MKKTKKILLTIILILLISGCGKIPKLENGQDVMFEFTEGNISVEEFYEILKGEYANKILFDTIDSYLLNKTYKTTAEETSNINKEITNIKNTLKAQYNDEVTFEQYIEYYYGTSTEAKFKESLSLNYKRTLAIKDYIKENITKKEINDYYDKEIVGDIKASHILITPNVTDEMTEEEQNKAQDEALTKAKQIITRLNNKEDFAALAKEFSNDTGSAEEGGDLGYFNPGTMVEEFKNAVIKLEIGKYTTEPVKSNYGYHIILKVNQKEKPALKTVKDTIINNIIEERLENDKTLQITALIKFREKNGLIIHDDNLKKQYDLLLESSLTNARNSK